MLHSNIILNRENKKPIIWDAAFKPNKKQKPLVIFCHGYKGFKDWGAWKHVANAFAKANFFFVKFNFSHNGGTINNPIDFPDLESFAENNYSKELDDLEDMVLFLTSTKNNFINEININNITLIGHSRGGGISILKASKDSKIKKLITWASVSDFGKRTATIGGLEEWRKKGVKYVLNGRTKQLMPHNYQFYKDYIANKEALDIKRACKKINIPYLIIHGKKDSSVSFSEAKELKMCNSSHELLLIEEADHVFNTKHPWLDNEIPKQLKTVIDKTISFINRKS